jgi:RNA polymerase sigma-70 factor (ECF subfamily)
MTGPPEEQQAEEQQAIDRLRRGDILGLETLVRLHQTRAVRTAYLVTRERALAEDIVQAAFLRAFERIHQLDPRRDFRPWFLTSVLHDAIKAARRSSRSVPLEPDVVEHAAVEPGPEALWENCETADEVWAALGRLSPEQRAAVVARYFLEMSEIEMSRALACPPSTVKWRLHAARARLRLYLAEE